MSARQLLYALSVAAAIAPASAEVSVSQSTATAGIVQLSSVEALANEVWIPVRVGVPQLQLNVTGTSRGDHSPALAVSPLTGLPEAAWSYWDGNDTEIAWSRFDGQAWSTPELLTTNSTMDLSPSITFDLDGATAIAWESHGSIARIEYRERQTNGVWSPIIHVSDESGDASNPTVAQYQGRIRVGYIQPSSGGQRPIRVASSSDTPDPWPAYFTPELIAMISFSGDIAPELHSYPDQLFTTWVNSSNEIGFARFDGTTWQTPQTETYTSAEDLPKARIRAKTRALHGP